MDKESHLAISCGQARFPVKGLGCIICVVGKGGPMVIPQTKWAIAKNKGFSLQSDSGWVLLQRATTRQLIEHEKPSWCLHGAFALHYILFAEGKFSAGY